MRFTPPFFRDCLGKRVLLYGESNTGKTHYTSQFVKFLLESIQTSPEAITILDFAPKMEIIAQKKIGGKIVYFYEKSKKCKYYELEGEITPPRLNALNKSELYKKICHNFKLCNKILEKYQQNPTPYLVVNDISIYFHLSKVSTFLEYIRESRTFFGNSYYGKLINSDFSRIMSTLEKKKVESLIEHMDKSYFLRNKFQ
ncbi:MAG: hypothetical protein ACOC44_00365 [Promethearchaeia archaeon]